MTEKIKCEICGKSFSSQDALNQHSAAKHSKEKETAKKPINKKKIKNFAIIFLILAALMGIFVWAFFVAANNTKECREADPSTTNIGGHKNLALHIHQYLKIIINGVEQQIPENIGILPGIMRPIHTHDSNGEIHTEGPCRRDFTLENFFKIWGKEFNSQCIFEYCIDKGQLTMTVNGLPNTEYENLVLKDKQEIIIEFVSDQT
ncbi:C2H2-type zinc finger protein [Candidatus Pacearchaeota archaeon]|nr:C2H2-type zinc finger protein [Candidatus Pacearchaeota archaeon]